MENQPVDWEPKDYFYEISENNYCYAFFNNGGSSSVLGASFMKGKDVLFDIENKLIGFAKSDCDYYSGKKPTRQ